MIDISIETKQCDVQQIDVVNRAATMVLAHEHTHGDVNITIVDNAKIHKINTEFRNVDAPTDVLSFPAHDGSDFDVTDGYLGDIAISFERAMEQSTEYGHSLERELAFLTVHGMLHILGYDHVDSKDECVMFPLQNMILEEMGMKK